MVTRLNRQQGPNRAAAVFSFIHVVVSFAVSWITYATDYNVKMSVTPVDAHTDDLRCDMQCPNCAGSRLSAALYSGTEVDLAWKAVYTDASVGGPLKIALLPVGGF
jgi:hypothetical protein